MNTTRTTPSTTDRFDIRSFDGTSIAVWTAGTGPALVMVHGSIADHTTFDSFIDVLRTDVTTYAMDRRGFGATPDGDRYAIEHDFEDVAAVVDDVAARTGGPVALFGHSYGANCVMGAATLTNSISHLIIYEPSLGLAYPAGSIEAIEEALAAGDSETAVLAVLVGVLDMTDDEIDALRSSSLWPVRLAAAPTIARECRVEATWEYRPGQFDMIAAPTIMLLGSATLPELTEATHAAAAAIPNAHIEMLHGHDHFAHKKDPEMVSALIRHFLSS